MKNKKTLKGFTLIELIIVMAIFGIIMVGTMSIINPVNKIIKNASLQEANSAAVDNMKRYFEGTLRYADAIEVFSGDLVDLDGHKVVDEKKAVENFITNHYNNRTNPGTEDPLTGKVRMLKVDNGNGGKVSEYEYDFTAGYAAYKWANKNKVMTKDAYGNDVQEYTKEPCTVELVKKDDTVINPVYYENYSFYFIPGYNKQTNVSDTSIINSALDASGSTVFNASKDKTDVYYATVEPVDSSVSPYKFNRDLFSLSVMTYKKDNAMGNTKSIDATKEYDYSGLLFKSPFALTNINASLVNINSSFSSDKYGPIRWDGETNEGNYNPLKMVDIATPTDGKWDYEQINAQEARLINQRYCGYDAQPGQCLYFIYTLPDMK
ncbi:MAG TPA: type II secretion system protein [Ruminococcus sp.]|nr:type II secretion system protein [Ruminococcus sp.]